jgi:beta-glucanase (GH16 family)
MTLIWQDEFEGDELDPNNWTHEIGNGVWGWGNNESQYYLENNTFTQDGHLVIEAREENYFGFDYTSSRIITKGKFDFQYGRVDIRAALPYGQGIWPALWMLGSSIDDEGWPACGEIDIMELLGQEPNRVYGTAHWSFNGQHTEFSGNIQLPSGDFNQRFHVFSIEWDENQIRWYMNDQQYHSLDITPADRTEFQEKFFFIFNIAVGGNWPGYPDETTTFPQRMIVDYIRVFQEN